MSRIGTFKEFLSSVPNGTQAVNFTLTNIFSALVTGF